LGYEKLENSQQISNNKMLSEKYSMAKFALIIIFFFTIFQIDENKREISPPIEYEPTSPSFGGRCLDHLDDDSSKSFAAFLSLKLQCSNLREMSIIIIIIISGFIILCVVISGFILDPATLGSTIHNLETTVP